MTPTRSRLALLIASCGIGFSVPTYAQTVVYDNFEATGGYTLADYYAKWANPYGLGEMAVNDTRDFSAGKFAISAAPFQTAYDFSVFDHIKYLATSNASFSVPTGGALMFSSTIQAATPGAVAGHVVNGTYIQSGLPYSASTLEGQQAAAVMNMIDFKTGQLFDWFISGTKAMALIERLPSSVTNPALPTSDPSYVGIDKMYTQIIGETDIGSGPQNVAIKYNDNGSVDFLLNGFLFSHVDNVGIPLDQQGVAFSGTYPSYGPGEALGGTIRSFTIGTGLFSLLDAFPFQHPDRPDLAVSLPLSERAFGQGVVGSFDDVTVTTLGRTDVLPVPEVETWAMMLLGFGAMGCATRVRRRTSKAAA